jgi:serine/threonine-protein kinase
MVNRGPLVTLCAVFGLVVVLLAFNYSRQPEPTGQVASAAAPTTTATTAPPPSATSAPPTTTPPATPFPAQAVYVGHTADGAASVAVAVKDDQAVSYVCDGTALEAWLQGSAANGVLSLRSNDGATLTGALANGQLAGTLTVGPTTWPFSAAPVDAPAGLYRANAANGGLLDKIGWIVQPDGSYVGLRDRGGSVEPAPPFDPSTPTVVVDGNQVPVELVVGDSGAG